MEAKKQTTVMG